MNRTEIAKKAIENNGYHLFKEADGPLFFVVINNMRYEEQTIHGLYKRLVESFLISED